MTHTAISRALKVSSVSDGSASRNDMRAAWRTVYRGCRVSLHNMFDSLPDSVTDYLLTGKPMVTTNSLNTDFDRSLLEDNDAVIHIIEKRNQREVELVLLDDHARQITANWLLHPDSRWVTTKPSPPSS